MHVTRVRKVALKIIMASLEEGRWANKLLVPNLFEIEDPRDQKLLTELVYGTIKMKLRLDWTIQRYLKKHRLEDLTPPIRNILRLSAYQILFMRIPHYAAVSEGVKLARRFGHRGTASLVNAVLRRIADEKPVPKEPWVLHSHPEWLYRRWLELWGEERAVQIMQHNNTPAPIYIRVNTLKTTVDAVIKSLEVKGIGFEKVDFPPEAIKVARAPQLIGLPESFYYVQDRSSQMIAHLMSPKPGWTVYDLAAAPGGKITHIAALMGDEGHIKAVELHRSRALEMKKVIERLGIGSIEVVVGDGSSIMFDRKADGVLTDVPCSGLGTLRRRPELRWRMRPDRIPELAKIQKAILENAAANTRIGGIIVYSTCTIEPTENQFQIENFLREHPEFRLEPAQDYVPPEYTQDGYLFVDGVTHDCDFMFGARLRKVG